MRSVIATSILIFTVSVSADTGIPTQHQPHPDAPEGLQQFGRLAGEWLCRSERPDGEGGWVTRPGRASWNWYYINHGFAVQDVWDPLFENPDKTLTPRTGTNLRVYNAESDSWIAFWTTGSQPEPAIFEGEQEGDTLVMRRDAPGNANIPAHKAKITFFNISDRKFDWRYEGAAMNNPEAFSEQSRLFCEKQ